LRFWRTRLLDVAPPEFYRRMFEQMELLDRIGFHQV
jgi:hypothetical protein